MIVKFNNSYLERLFENKPVSGKPKYSSEVVIKFKKTILRLQFADNIKQLSAIKGLNFEALKGNMKGFYSVRVDYHYRLILSVEHEGSIVIKEILVIEDLTNHYQ
ncbi:MAG TPA: type II toxin-antitoxin system RelE/ParE family toxin [Flavisolibacter sp.]|nr:type II toxin-antitoxin system RelE/ParE family toxin [Flavisolibacter sp.]